MAVVGASLRRRLLIIDGEPHDMAASALVEAVKMTDPGLPIVLVRYGWDAPPTVHNGVHVCPGPFVCGPMQQLLLQKLAATRP
jgi:hypothetical protein